MTRSKTMLTAVLVGSALAVGTHAIQGQEQDTPPLPRTVHAPVDAPPADAIVLFDGSSAERFRHMNGDAAKWTIEEGALTVKPRTGGIISDLRFGAAQIHLEFRTPPSDTGEGQGKGNSGVYLQGRYEVQVLDSFENETYPLGQCGAIYGQHPPLVNASRPAGTWQTYDIIYRPPVFDEDAKVITPASVTVLHNGVLIQDHAEVRGTTTAAPIPEGPGDGPLFLQDHGDLVQYRNIWVRPL
jgi:hypothetical protein